MTGWAGQNIIGPLPLCNGSRMERKTAVPATRKKLWARTTTRESVSCYSLPSFHRYKRQPISPPENKDMSAEREQTYSSALYLAATGLKICDQGLFNAPHGIRTNRESPHQSLDLAHHSNCGSIPTLARVHSGSSRVSSTHITPKRSSPWSSGFALRTTTRKSRARKPPGEGRPSVPAQRASTGRGTSSYGRHAGLPRRS